MGDAQSRLEQDHVFRMCSAHTVTTPALPHWIPPTTVRCRPGAGLNPVRYQIAQKLHACTEPPADGRRNDRFRDLIDLLLLEELVEDSDWDGLRAACEEIFELRNMHKRPPVVTIFDGWSDTYPALAAEVAFPISDANDAAWRVQQLIQRIATRPS